MAIAPGSDPQLAERLHPDVSTVCFVARPVNFPVHHDPIIVVQEQQEQAVPERFPLRP